MTLIRVFVSIPIPDTSPLDDVFGELRMVKGVKVTSPSQLHITLRFIGDVDDRKVPKIVKAVEKTVEGMEPFTVSLSGTGTFPPKGNPRIVWIGLEPEDVLKGIAGRMSESLSEAGISFDEKPFKGHVTVGRCNGPVDLSEFLRKHDKEDFLEFRCSGIKVMKSILKPSGAVHTVLSEINLG